MTALNTAYQAPIQFRPSDPLKRWIAEYARSWQVTDNEAAKRLTALAASQLDIDQYPLMESLSEALCGPAASRTNFARACEQIKIAVDAANRAREEMGEEPLEHEERTRFIQKTIEEVTNNQVKRQNVKHTKGQHRRSSQSISVTESQHVREVRYDNTTRKRKA